MNTRVGVPELGEQIGGRYELIKTLGSGAAGVVYEAAHVHIGRRVALKWLYPHLAAEEVTAKRFFLEARAACLVDHPNVIDVFDGGKDRDSLFLAMELLEGEPLSDRMRRGFDSPDQLVELLIPALRGVAAAHEAGIIHRDLKPENIFLARARGGRSGGPKVLDFGISKLTENREQLTSAGSFVGSPYYMAPEQIQDASAVDARTDIYAIGVILYESLAGQLPFESDSLTELFFKVTRDPAPPLLGCAPDVDPKLAALVHKAIATDPDDRFATADELARALMPWRAAPSEAPTRDRRDTDIAPRPEAGTDGAAWELPPEQTIADGRIPSELRNDAPREALGAFEATQISAGRRGDTDDEREALVDPEAVTKMSPTDPDDLIRSSPPQEKVQPNSSAPPPPAPVVPLSAGPGPKRVSGSRLLRIGLLIAAATFLVTLLAIGAVLLF